ncbi:MAG TPA: ABC transporter ATP-binding protein [Alphaproteobacteria bacterium]|nr:ABC transporter ATP-binding protein [Alphaproteobacteria bacterium]
MMLSLDEVESGYGDSLVLKGVTLTVAAGQVTALLGRNGMGKSTLMKTIMGLLPVKRGIIGFDGAPINGLRPDQISNRGIAFVPQGREIFMEFTVEENLLLGTLGKPGTAGWIPDLVFEHFPILHERKKQIAGTMSGGQQQQLAIGRALAGRPKMLLLDEPSEGIQPSIVEQIAATLKAIAEREQLTILLVEQNVEMVLDMAGTCAFIENGRIVATHATQALRDDDRLIHRYLGL